MKKESVNRILFLGLLSMLMISIVSAADSTTFWDQLTGSGRGVSQFFSDVINLNVGGISQVVAAQWLLFFLVFLIVYAISANIPFLGKNRGFALRGGVSIIIGILAVFFLKREEVYTILQSYTALGVALTVIVPFFVIAVVSKDLLESRHTVISKFIWILFLGTLMVRYLTADPSEIGAFGKGAFWVVAILSLVLLIWEGRIYLYMFKKEMKEAGSLHDKLVLAKLVAEVNHLEEQMMSVEDPDAQEVLARRYNDLLNDLKKRGVNYSRAK
jgi:hypothetical protein